MSAGTAPRTIIVTAGDTNVMPLLKGLITSLEAFPERAGVAVACFNLGQTETDMAWLRAHEVELALPGSHFGLSPDNLNAYERAVIVRPFLRDYFPGYDVYLWIDSDVWLQSWSVVETFVQGAVQTGLAIAHERERAYAVQAWLLGWFAKHLILGNGPVDGLWLLSRPHLNAGLFAMSAQSPYWELWAELYEKAWRRTGKLTPHDQFSLNRLVYGRALTRRPLPVSILPTRCNWIVVRGQPMWNDELGAFCEPYPPYRPIGALHLAGPGKTTRYTIRQTGGGHFEALLLQGTRPPS